MIAFTHELSLLSPEAFAEQVLVGQAGAVHVVVGENYRFGHAAEGDADDADRARREARLRRHRRSRS